MHANARNAASLVRAALGCDLFINTVPAAFNEAAVRAALRLRTHYPDMASHLEHDPFKAEQLKFHDRFERRGKLALINAGAAPGLTNVLEERRDTGPTTRGAGHSTMAAPAPRKGHGSIKAPFSENQT